MAFTPDVEAATALKVKGNKAFSQHDWLAAIDFYTQAIEKNDQDPSFYCNRAQVSHLVFESEHLTNLRRPTSSLNLMAMRLRMLLTR
jgi:hypothetical protein